MPPRRGIRPWLQISMRMLLAAVVVLCIALALWTNRARRQEALVRKIISLGGHVTYQHQFGEDNKPLRGGVPAGPAWLRRLIGDQPFLRLHSVTCMGLEDADLQRLAEFTTIEDLWLGQQLTDKALEHVARLPQLRKLIIESPRFTDRGVQHLADLKNLESLNLSYGRISDEGLNSLAALTDLKQLCLFQTQVTYDGYERLRGRLPELKISNPGGRFPSVEEEKPLVQQLIKRGARFEADKEGWIDTVIFFGPEATDETLAILPQLRRLAKLNLHDTRITSAAIQALLQVHPSLKLYPGSHMPAAEEADAVTALQRLGARLSLDREGHLRTFQWVQQESPEQALAHLAGLTHLKGVTIHGGHLTEAAWLHLGRLTTLETLWLVRVPAADANLRHLKNLSQLRRLIIGGQQITDPGLEHLAPLTALTDLIDTALSTRSTRLDGSTCRPCKFPLAFGEAADP